MCGIFGATKCSIEEASKAADAIRYRGPDFTGSYSDDEIALVHHRLAIIDLDARSNQPLVSSDGRYRILFNGEIYNFRELKLELERTGDTFRTTSDTEVILQAFIRYGAGMTKMLRGMYAIVIHDAQSGTVHLFRDHAGIKPLYVYTVRGLVAFSSEVKALSEYLSASGVRLDVSRDGLSLFWQFGYIPAPWTLYEGIRRMRPGAKITIDCLTGIYTEADTEPFQAVIVGDEPAFAALIEQRILGHLISDVPVGLFFSGGTDSSVLAMVLKRHGIKLNSYSVVVEGKSDDEIYIRGIGERLGLNPIIIPFGLSEAELAYDTVMGRIDEPIADGSLFPSLMVAQRAAQDVKVVLSGEGGDEMFGGYGRFRMLAANAAVMDDKVSLLDQAYCAIGPMPGRRSLYKRLMTGMHRPASYYFADTGLIENLRAYELMKQLYRDEGVGPLRYDARTYLEGDLLRKIDLATSYTSIEGRVPFLDYDIMANASKFASHMVEGGIHKAVLKRMLEKELPRELIHRKKSGFGVPFGHLVAQSPRITSDVKDAVQALDRDGLLPLSKKRFVEAARQNPNLLLAAVMLNASLRRTGAGI